MEINSSQLNSINNEKPFFHKLTLHNQSLNSSSNFTWLLLNHKSSPIWRHFCINAFNFGCFLSFPHRNMSAKKHCMFAFLYVFMSWFFLLAHSWQNCGSQWSFFYRCSAQTISLAKCNRTLHSLQDFKHYQQILTIHQPWKHYYIKPSCRKALPRSTQTANYQVFHNPLCLHNWKH